MSYSLAAAFCGRVQITKGLDVSELVLPGILAACGSRLAPGVIGRYAKPVGKFEDFDGFPVSRCPVEWAIEGAVETDIGPWRYMAPKDAFNLCDSLLEAARFDGGFSALHTPGERGPEWWEGLDWDRIFADDGPNAEALAVLDSCWWQLRQEEPAPWRPSEFPAPDSWITAVWEIGRNAWRAAWNEEDILAGAVLHRERPAHSPEVVWLESLPQALLRIGLEEPDCPYDLVTAAKDADPHPGRDIHQALQDRIDSTIIVVR